MIPAKLKILLIEDNPADAVLIQRQIEKAVTYPKVLHISEFDKISNALESFEPDIIISDYQLEGFTGVDVLDLVTKSPVSIPFVFVTGTINDEELAASTILNGASGYILKENINSLNEKLEPHFLDILNSNKKDKLSSSHVEMFEELKDMFAQIENDKEIVRGCYHELKHTLKKYTPALHDE